MPFAVPFLVRWVRGHRWGLLVRVAMVPDAPRPEVLGGYLAEIARRLDERPERMRVVFDGGGSRDRAISLDVTPDRALRIVRAVSIYGDAGSPTIPCRSP